MAYLITHFFAGGTEAQYNAALGAAHPPKGLPRGQTFHAAGPTEGGWLIVALWDSRKSCDTFIQETLIPSLKNTKGTFAGPPEERSCEIVNLVAQ